MGQTVTITCDHCDKDITNVLGGSLMLGCTAPQVISTGTGLGLQLHHLIHVEPQLDRPYYFCGPLCLVAWSVDRWRSLMEQECKDNDRGEREESDR